MSRLRIAWLRLTGCSGCQLSLLNAEGELAAAAEVLALVDFPLVTSRNDRRAALDVALVEGAISTPDELQELLSLRRRATALVAVGACALGGGVPALASARRGERFAQVYGPSKSCTSFPPQPVCHYVPVDHEVSGCPPEPAELIMALGSLVHKGIPELDHFPVCFECRLQENRCLLFETSPRHPCLGPLTRAGCRANCPSRGVPCEGCRGNVPEACREQLLPLLVDTGLSTSEIEALLQRFGESPS